MIYYSEKFSVLLDLHHVVEDSLYFSVGSTVNATDIEIDDLNYISMFRFERHFHFVEKHLEYFLLIASLEFGLFDLLVHDFDCDALVGGKIDSHLNSAINPKLTSRTFRTPA